MHKVAISLAVLALGACSKPADTNVNAAAVETNTSVSTPATFELNETTWKYTREGKDITESIYPDGHYISWVMKPTIDYIDQGSAVMKDTKVCFTSSENHEGEDCWTTQPTEIGQSMETTSDKGEKLTVTRVKFVTAPTIPQAQ
jgi:hypothetical protein